MCHLPRRMGTNHLKRVDIGLLVFRLWLRMKSTAIGRENSAGKIIDLLLFLRNILELYPLDGERLYDYSGVNFSFAAFQNLNFSRVFSFS